MSHGVIQTISAVSATFALFVIGGCAPAPTAYQQPSLSLSAPNETGTPVKLVIADTVTLRWTGINFDADRLAVLFSSDSDLAWTDTLSPIEPPGPSALRARLPLVYTTSGFLSINDGIDSLVSNRFTLKDIVLETSLDGDTLFAGDTLSFRWRAFDAITSVTAYLYLDGVRGRRIPLIEEASVTTSMPQWPTHSWVIPDTLAGDNCYIQVEDYLAPSPRARDVNREPFVIIAR
jgi:hypothetical protein